MTDPKTRPYITNFQGTERLIEAKSREQVRDHLLAPILKDITPPLDTIRPASAAEVAKLMRASVEYEEAGKPVDDLLFFGDLEDGMLVYMTSEAWPDDLQRIQKILQRDEGFVFADPTAVPMDVYFQPTENEKSLKMRRLTDDERQSFLDLPQK